MRIDAVLLGVAAIVTSLGLSLAMGFVCFVDLDSMSFAPTASRVLLFAALCCCVCAPCCCLGGLTVCVWTGLMNRRLDLFRQIRCDHPV